MEITQVRRFSVNVSMSSPQVTLKTSGPLFYQDRSASVFPLNDKTVTPPLFTGERIPDHLLERFPSRIEIADTIWARNPLPDAVGYHLVSEKLREIIEEVEPGRHQFLPVKLVGPDEHQFYFFNILNWVASPDFYDPELLESTPGVRRTECYSPSLPHLGRWHPLEIHYDAEPPILRRHFENAIICRVGSPAFHTKPQVRGGADRLYCRDEFSDLCRFKGVKGLDFSVPTKLTDGPRRGVRRVPQSSEPAADAIIEYASHVKLFTVNSSNTGAEIWFETGPHNPVPLRRRDFQFQVSNPLGQPPVGLIPGRIPSLRFCESLREGEAQLMPPIRVHTEPDLNLPERGPAFCFFMDYSFVNDEAKRIIETFAPDAHQFIQTRMVDAQSGQDMYTYTEWYYFNMLVCLRPHQIVDFCLAQRLRWWHKKEVRTSSGEVQEVTVIGYDGTSHFDCVFKPSVVLKHPILRVAADITEETACIVAHSTLHFREDVWNALAALPDANVMYTYNLYDVMGEARDALSRLLHQSD